MYLVTHYKRQSVPLLQVYDKCFLGSSPVSTVDAVFQGQMSAVYLFKEPLSHERVAVLHKLGPTYKVVLVKYLKLSLVVPCRTLT